MRNNQGWLARTRLLISDFILIMHHWLQADGSRHVRAYSHPAPAASPLAVARERVIPRSRPIWKAGASLLTIPPPSRSRRRLSRSIPWQIPAAGLLVLFMIVLALWRPLRSAPKDTAVVPQPEIAPANEISQTDPLDDPSIRGSELESADQINILVLGTDGRDEEDGPPRTDLMMVVLLDRSRQHATLISIPRDLWVPIPGYGEGKINTAFFLGSIEERGAELARETVEELIGLSLHYTVQVDFNGFRTLVDEMGGIELDVPTAIDDQEYPDGNYGTIHLQIPAGQQLMDGETALRYVRTRHGGMDQDRSARQQAVLMAVREKALSPAQLARAPFHLRTLYRVVESDLTLGDLFELARFGRTLDRESISMHVLNGELTWPVLTWNGQDALMYDPAVLRDTIREWATGEVQ